MIKVVKHGNQIYEKTCDRCGCVFTYDINDTDKVEMDTFEKFQLGNPGGYSFVRCPECGNKVYHSDTRWK